jgi:heat shock protein beta
MLSSKKLWLVVFLGIVALSALLQVTAQDDSTVTQSSTVASQDLGDGFTDDQKKDVEAKAQKFEFQAEVNRMMDIIINSLYSNREIFLRELISNASDALDKIRFLSLKDRSVLGEGEHSNLEIKIRVNKDAKTISIRDTGVGMTKDELVSHLGTIARSGTSKFVEAASKGTDALSLIGQFGVGFYSVFLIADRVTVVTKSNDDPQQWIWQSAADSSYTISEDPRGNTLGRGSEIILHLKADATEFLDVAKVKSVATKYSEFINFPIYVLESQTVEREVPVEEEEEVKAEQEKSEEDVEVSEEEEKKDEKPKTKKVSETTEEWKLLNENKPIWTRSASEVSDEEYNKFYKALTKETEDPIEHVHFTAEGSHIQFKSLLFIPSKAASDLYDKYYGKQNNIKLFVRRVLIAEEFDSFLPKYLNFIRGVVDSDDLPLNVGRETIQRHKVIDVISKKITKRVLDLLDKMAEESKSALEDKKTDELEEEEKKEQKDKYSEFYKQFGKSIRLGVVEDQKNKKVLTKLVRFYSSRLADRLVGLEEYVANMKPKQQSVYYLACESRENCESSPFLERARKRGYEVLFLTEPLDEYTVQNIPEFEGKKLVSLSKEGVDFADNDETRQREKSLKEEFKDLTEYLKGLYGSKVSKVALSFRITDSPAVLVTAQYGWSANMERIMKAQALANSEQASFMISPKTLEINARHPIIKELKNRVSLNKEDESLKDMAFLLYDQALLASGFQMDNPADFSNRVQRLLKLSLNVDPAATVEEEPETEEIEPEQQNEDDEQEEASAEEAHSEHDEL